MTALASYTDLLAEMALWLDRDTTPLPIATFIRLFEARMNRRLRSPDMETTFTQDVVAGTDTYALNSRVRQLRSVKIDGHPMGSRTPVELAGLYPIAFTGRPVTYAVAGESIILAPVPISDYTLTYSGFATLVGLDTNNATNWLLDDHPDAYLFGSLCMAEAYLKDDNRLAVWKQAWDEAIAEIVREANAKRLGSGPLIMRGSVIEQPSDFPQPPTEDDPGDLAGIVSA